MKCLNEDRLPATTTFNLELEILGKPVCFDIAVADRAARLSDIVPLARNLAKSLARTTIDMLNAAGECVPCRKGCSACCSYLAPLSVPEAFRLAEELSAMPAREGEPLIQSSIETARKILDNKPVNFELEGSTETNDALRSKEIGDWYAGLGLPCPFLSNGLCVLYEHRPIACREHIVTGSAKLCDLTSTDQADAVKMPVSVLECLGRLAAELEQSDVEAVMLPLALPWAQENTKRSGRTWPALTMVERFVEIIQTTARVPASAA